jgi:hypothetical protein
MRPSMAPLIRSTIVLPERKPEADPTALKFRSSHSPNKAPPDRWSFDLISVLYEVLAQRIASERTDPLLL